MTELETLKEKFTKTSDKNKIPLIEQIVSQGEDGYQYLRDFLSSGKEEANPIMGKAFLTLKQSEQQINQDFLQQYFSSVS